MAINYFNPESITKDMRFDCLGVKQGLKFDDAFPELSNIESWGKLISDSQEMVPVKIKKYIILVYSKDSILNTVPRRELNERKIQAAKLSGFRQDNEGKFWPSVYRQVINMDVHSASEKGGFNRPRQILDMVIDYLIFQNQWTWTKIIAIEENMQLLLKAYMQPIKTSGKGVDSIKGITANIKKNDFIQMIEDDEAKLEKLYSNLFNNDSEIKNELNGRIEMTEERKRSSIEGWARVPFGGSEG
jgi:hypothetical protein